MLTIMWLLVIFSGFFGIGFMIGAMVDNNGKQLIVGLICLIGFFLFVYWATAVYSDKGPYKYEAEYICYPTDVKIGFKTVQEISFRHKGSLNTIVLTDIFRGYIDPKTKLKAKVNGTKTVYWVELEDKLAIEIVASEGKNKE